MTNIHDPYDEYEYEDDECIACDLRGGVRFGDGYCLSCYQDSGENYYEDDDDYDE